MDGCTFNAIVCAWYGPRAGGLGGERRVGGRIAIGGGRNAGGRRRIAAVRLRMRMHLDHSSDLHESIRRVDKRPSCWRAGERYQSLCCCKKTDVNLWTHSERAHSNWRTLETKNNSRGYSGDRSTLTVRAQRSVAGRRATGSRSQADRSSIAIRRLALFELVLRTNSNYRKTILTTGREWRELFKALLLLQAHCMHDDESAINGWCCCIAVNAIQWIHTVRC